MCLFSIVFATQPIQVPVLITHGDEDEIVLLTAAHEHAALIPHAQVSIYSGIGHAPFWEVSDRFNQELSDFARQV